MISPGVAGRLLEQGGTTSKCTVAAATTAYYPPRRSLARQQGREIPSEPMLFLKPTTSFVKMGGNIQVMIDLQQ